MYNISAVKWLQKAGYRQKLIQIIMGYSQSYISKICAKEGKYVPSIEHINEEQKIRKYVVDKILECKPITRNEAMFNETDIAYIKLMDFCLVDREQIKAVYYNISPYKIARAFRDNRVTIMQFQPQLLGITEEEYSIFLEKVF